MELRKALKRGREVEIVTGKKESTRYLGSGPMGNVTSPICKSCGYSELS